MAKTDRTTLKSYFELGDRPTAGQFTDFIDSSLDLAASGQPPLQSTASLQAASPALAVTQSGSVIKYDYGTHVGGSAMYMVPDFGPGGDGVTNPGASQVIVRKFYFPIKMAVTQMSFRVFTAGGADAAGAVGVYSGDGASLLLSVSGISTSATGVKNASIPATTLNPGFYWSAFMSNDGTTKYTVVNDTNNYQGLLNACVVHSGSAGNIGSAGTLPTTVGTVVAVNTTTGLPALILLQG